MKGKSALELAIAHWDWLEPIIKYIPLDRRDDKLLGYLVKTAMIHGAKHEREKQDNDR